MTLADRRAIQKWMERLADGDRGAFDPLFVMLWPIALRFATRLVGPPDAADAAQTALAKVFSNAHAFDVERDATAWILGIIAYECRTIRTRVRRRHEVPDEGRSEVADDTAELGEDLVIRRDLENAFVEAVQDLSTVDREIIQAVLTGQEPQARGPTYRKRLSRALARLRQLWSSKHDTDG
jgi:DNA-directed RNA polymerase specialized sigma24 family protein